MMKFSSQAAVLNFLNEIADEYPDAISFAPGRPTDKFFERLNPSALLSAFLRYEHYTSEGQEPHAARSRLLQYGRTAGIITDLVAQQLRADEGVPARADRLLITSGCQEALALCLPALCSDPGDVLLVCNPTYAGATGTAYANGVSIVPISNTRSELVEDIEQAIREVRHSGRRARALYLIPNFDNPTGRTLDEAGRRAILSLCAESRIVVLEDNAYGMFRYEGRPVPSMAELDEAGSVIHLSTFSKTLAPALRVGAATLPETLFGDQAASRELWQELVQRKSFVTVNTSPITQAIVGGFLLEQNGSLKDWIQPVLGWYRDNRNAMLSQLQEAFEPNSGSIRWNTPSGGFFLSVDLPFRFDRQAMLECATNYGVIVMPMSFFALDDSQEQRIRLSFSAVDPQQIRDGVEALSRYVKRRTNQGVQVNRPDQG